MTTIEFAPKENAGVCLAPFNEFDRFWVNQDLFKDAEKLAKNTSPVEYFKALQKQPMTVRNDSVADQAVSTHGGSSNQDKWLAARNARNTAGSTHGGSSNQDKWLAARNARNTAGSTHGGSHASNQAKWLAARDARSA
jgi:hypothetical protein